MRGFKSWVPKPFVTLPVREKALPPIRSGVASFGGSTKYKVPAAVSDLLGPAL